MISCSFRGNSKLSAGFLDNVRRVSQEFQTGLKADPVEFHGCLRKDSGGCKRFQRVGESKGET